MEALRWILIAAGIFFILAIYVLGKKHRDRGISLSDDLETEMDIDEGLNMNLPEFSANNLDDVDEGVGAVRVISGDPHGEVVDESIDGKSFLEDIYSEEGSSFNESNRQLDGSNDYLAGTNTEPNRAPNKIPGDMIVVYILPKGDAVLAGSQINSAAQALGLSFGEMNIFHYINDGRTIFSLANMLEPGSFDAATIHDLTTSGLTLFMQMESDDPMDDLTEMLQRSYQLAGLLEARLCNHKREPLTEQDAENYRAQVRDFA